MGFIRMEGMRFGVLVVVILGVFVQRRFGDWIWVCSFLIFFSPSRLLFENRLSLLPVCVVIATVISLFLSCSIPKNLHDQDSSNTSTDSVTP